MAAPVRLRFGEEQVRDPRARPDAGTPSEGFSAEVTPHLLIPSFILPTSTGEVTTYQTPSQLFTCMVSFSPHHSLPKQLCPAPLPPADEEVEAEKSQHQAQGPVITKGHC